ncbi:MAG TPA: discoidin domain-containing protein [Thermoanaerobaculia bacterium]|nr:discoidin domain-containing protein [Thermoanaerobaculia bacterium]
MAAEDFSGRAILSDQSFSSGDVENRFFDQLYELRFDRRVSDPFSYLAFFRGERSDGHSTVADETSALRFTQLEPHAEASYTLPTIHLFGRWDLVDSHSQITGAPDDRRRLEHLYGTFAFLPDAYPGFRLVAQRDHASSPTVALDQTRTYLQGDLEYRLGKLDMIATARQSEFNDAENGLDRKTHGVQGSLLYEDTLLRDRLTVFANVLASKDRETDTTRGDAAAGETPVLIGQAFSSIDPTPEDSREAPAAPVPALIDGDLRTPSVIDLGPTGSSFENISVDLKRFTDVDTFRIDVRDSGGNVVLHPGAIDFTVYVSTDALRWTPVPGVSTEFLLAESLYEVRFPKTFSRFLKVVSFDLAPVEARVTEIRAFVHDRFGPSTTDTIDITLATANAALTFHPLSTVTLFYYGLFNESREESATRPNERTDDASQFATLNWDLSRRVSLFGQFETRHVTSTLSSAQNYEALTADLRYVAERNISVAFEGVQAKQEDADVRSETRTASVRTYLRVLRTVDADANLGIQRQEFLDSDLSLREWFASGYTSMDLTSELHLRIDGSYTRNETPGVLLGQRLSNTDERYTGDFYYRPGPELGVDVRIGWVRSGNLTGLVQNYRLDWRPFPYGSLNVGGRYEEDVEPFTNRRFRRAIFDPSWRLNPHMTIDLNYTKEMATGVPNTDVGFAAFTWTW